MTHRSFALTSDKRRVGMGILMRAQAHCLNWALLEGEESDLQAADLLHSLWAQLWKDEVFRWILSTPGAERRRK